MARIEAAQATKGEERNDTRSKIQPGNGQNGMDIPGSGRFLRASGTRRAVVAPRATTAAKSALPHVAPATADSHATRGAAPEEAMPHVAQSGGKVVEMATYATRGINPLTRYAQETKPTPQPAAKWFTFERVKPSVGTVAYRYRWWELDPETGDYKRMAPVYVRYLTDAADAVLQRRGKDVIKEKVKQWYGEKCGQAVSAGQGVG